MSGPVDLHAALVLKPTTVRSWSDLTTGNQRVILNEPIEQKRRGPPTRRGHAGMSPQAATNPVVQKLRLHDTDTGSPQVQIALLTERINQLSSHFQAHKKDFNSRQGLLKMVSRRRALLEYLKSHDEGAYRTLLDALNLRK